ncbi:MAG: Rieske 2Fe-2S domain-containing protein [Hahellaceae bacterium]|nr:Rieske 2Fe-2S domain-containing protein [Hahellaceae bacterium]
MRIDINPYLPLEEGTSRSLELDDPAVFLVQFDGQLRAYLNRCPHLGIELNWMPDQFLESGGDLIICSTHGALFKIDDGLCISGPCQGQALTQLTIKHDAGGVFVVLPQ